MVLSSRCLSQKCLSAEPRLPDSGDPGVPRGRSREGWRWDGEKEAASGRACCQIEAVYQAPLEMTRAVVNEKRREGGMKAGLGPENKSEVANGDISGKIREFLKAQITVIWTYVLNNARCDKNTENCWRNPFFLAETDECCFRPELSADLMFLGFFTC